MSKINIAYFILWMIYQVNCFKEYNEISPNSEDMSYIPLEIGLSQTHSIEFKQSTTLNFNISDDSSYQINIHAISCNFNIDFNGTIMNQINLDTYSVKINRNCSDIIIKPLIDIIDGKEKENYDLRKCHLSINSINFSQPNLKIENKDDAIFFF